jgi:hypothetical protein
MFAAGEDALLDAIGPNELDAYTVRILLELVYAAMRKAEP